MNVLKFSAFSDGNLGGNPAGVVLCDALPSDAEMQRIAAEVGFSETAFAMCTGTAWRVRYFSPEAEVPFCGHATIALGAALALARGDGVFALVLNDANISVAGQRCDHVARTASRPYCVEDGAATDSPETVNRMRPLSTRDRSAKTLHSRT